MAQVTMPRFYTRPNDEEECWEVLERGAIRSYDDGVEDGVIARLYDGNTLGSFLADLLVAMLNVGAKGGK